MCLSTRYNYTDERSLDTVNCAAVDEHLHHPIIKKKKKKPYRFFVCMCVFFIDMFLSLFFKEFFV